MVRAVFNMLCLLPCLKPLLSLPYLSPPSVLIFRFCSIVLLFTIQYDVKTDVKEPALNDRTALNCLPADVVEHNSIHAF